MKEQNKKHQNAQFIDEKLTTKSLMFFVSFFHLIFKISNFNCDFQIKITAQENIIGQ